MDIKESQKHESQPNKKLIFVIKLNKERRNNNDQKTRKDTKTKSKRDRKANKSIHHEIRKITITSSKLLDR